MANVLLIEPHENLNIDKKPTVFTPLSLVYLGTAIEEKHTVKIYDRNLDKSDSNFLKFFNDFKPQIVGFTSGMSTMLIDLMHLGKMIKKTSSNTIIIVGGVAVTSEPDIFLNEWYIDYILRGEGEEAFLEFCDTYDKNPKNLGKLDNINNNPTRPFLDMDNLKLPNYNLLDLDKYEEFYINLTRGCPGNCSFCYNSRMWGKNGKPFIRAYSIDRTLELFKEVVEKYKKRVFLIIDDNFVTLKSRCIAVCNLLSKYNVHFYTAARADSLDDEIMIALKKAGCHTLHIGIESGSQKVLNFLKKGTTIEKNRKAIQLCKKYKIISDASLMIGLPTETIEDLKETIKFVKKNKPDVANVHIYNTLPAPLFDYCVDMHLVNKPKTLKEWAGIGDIFQLKRALNELKKFRIYRRKINRFFFWISIGEFKYVEKMTKSFLKNLFKI